MASQKKHRITAAFAAVAGILAAMGGLGQFANANPIAEVVTHADMQQHSISHASGRAYGKIVDSVLTEMPTFYRAYATAYPTNPDRPGWYAEERGTSLRYLFMNINNSAMKHYDPTHTFSGKFGDGRDFIRVNFNPDTKEVYLVTVFDDNNSFTSRIGQVAALSKSTVSSNASILGVTPDTVSEIQDQVGCTDYDCNVADKNAHRWSTFEGDNEFVRRVHDDRDVDAVSFRDFQTSNKFTMSKGDWPNEMALLPHKIPSVFEEVTEESLTDELSAEATLTYYIDSLAKQDLAYKWACSATPTSNIGKMIQTAILNHPKNVDRPLEVLSNDYKVSEYDGVEYKFDSEGREAEQWQWALEEW
jgi:hypothetical protein